MDLNSSWSIATPSFKKPLSCHTPTKWNTTTTRSFQMKSWLTYNSIIDILDRKSFFQQRMTDDSTDAAKADR
jgi:hypothetical protein